MNVSKEIKRQWKKDQFRSFQVTTMVTVCKSPDGDPIKNAQNYTRYARLKSTPSLRRWAQSEARGGNSVARIWCSNKGIPCGR